MSVQLERARLLYAQSRYDQAEEASRRALAEEPNDPFAHALLALCLLQRDRHDEAEREANLAVSLGADLAYSHFVLGMVQMGRGRMPKAENAFRESVRIEPEDPDYYAVLAHVLGEQKRWLESLATSEEGLRLDPEHVGCINARANALREMGRGKEAEQALEDALAADPQDALTHANLGWTCLEKGKHEKALEHFREALRIDPTFEAARLGIVEAMKAKYFLYGIFLRYFLWMGKLSRAAQWAVVIGVFLFFRVIRGVMKSRPDLAPWLLPVMIVGTAVVIMTWVADPLFNLVLRLNRFGRLALSPEQIRASNGIGACLLGALASLAGGIVFRNGTLLLGALAFGLLLAPLSAIWNCPEGKARIGMTVFTGCLAALGAAGLAVPLLFGLFLLGAFLSTWIANGIILSAKR